jgi:hypothetical protein
VAYNGYIYAFGGFRNAAYQSSVLRAPLNADGTIGTWTTITSMPAIAGSPGFAYYNGYIYIIGGRDESVNAYTDTVQYASFNSDGSLNWGTTTTFPNLVATHSAYAYNGYLFAVGNLKNNVSTTIQVAPINTDGTLGSWTTQTNGFSTARTNESMVIYNGYMYIAGGNSGSTYLSSIEKAAVNTTNPANAASVVGTFSSATSLQEVRSTFSFVVLKGNLYALGGSSSGSVDTLTTEYVPINSDGSLGTWKYSTPLTSTQANNGTAVAGDNIYLVSGAVGGSRSRNVTYVSINNGGSGTPTSWTTNANTFSSGRWTHGSVAYNNYLYVLGGEDGSVSMGDVQYAPIGADGTVGSWTTTTALPTSTGKLRYLAPVVYKGHLYILGGNNGTGTVNEVWYAALNSDGTVGTWTQTSSFTNARSNLAAVVYNNTVYILGGNSGSTYYNDVQYAPINPNGSLGTWQSTSSFTTARGMEAAKVYNNKLYILGGYDGTNGLSSVQFASINSDGTLGSWTTAASLPGSLYRHDAYAMNGTICVVGGVYGSGSTFGGGTATNRTYCASIQSTGHLDKWHAMGALFTNARQGLATVYYNGFVFLTGGRAGGTYYNDVQTAAISTIARIGRYSKLIDLSTESIVSSIAFNGSISGGAKSILYRTAGADGVFGAVATSDSLSGSSALQCEGSSGIARYVWISVTIDDTDATIYADAASTFGVVTDITVNYEANNNGHAPPNLRLRGGKYFSNESLQPLDTCGA